MVATAMFELRHVTVRPVNELPCASRSEAAAWAVCAGCNWAGRVMLMEETAGGETLTVADPTFPSPLAEMTAEPKPTAVTLPFWSTLATLEFELLHVSGRPLITLPDASRGVADAVVVPPT